jgi:hypothetical protein
MESTIKTTSAPVSKCMHPGCKKKIGFVDRITGLCNCGKTFCVSHKPDTMHGCTFDYKSRDRITLASTLTKVVGEKLTTI